MAVVRKYGKPDLFLTFTASSDWPEIAESLGPGQSSHDRPDIVTRVFEMKAQELLSDLMDGGILGRVIAILAVVEWQKRGNRTYHISFELFFHHEYLKNGRLCISNAK